MLLITKSALVSHRDIHFMPAKSLFSPDLKSPVELL